MIDINTALADLLHHEGCINHLYQDTAGNVTVGIGELVQNVEAATKMPFVVGQKSATVDQIAADFVRVEMMEKAYAPDHYLPQHGPFVSMTNETCQARVVHRLGAEFFPGIVKLMPKFSTFPIGAQRAIVDMAYRLGLAGLAKFHVFITDCNRADFRGAAFESHVSSSRASRNEWCKGLLLQAAGSDTT